MDKKMKTKNTSRPAFAKASAGRPPIVAVLGHVDHGKTTLLDYIRKTHVAQGESGGITQHIGAYQIEVKGQNLKGKSNDQLITFIDTPGHEAFAKMRSRGATVADIALLVVAANDSVMPQTKESIEMIKKAGASMIVVMNKVDLPIAAPDKVKSDLAKAGVQVEGFGGDIPMVSVSAKAGTGIK
jgi:translation initiation factor IF-2